MSHKIHPLGNTWIIHGSERSMAVREEHWPKAQTSLILQDTTQILRDTYAGTPRVGQGRAKIFWCLRQHVKSCASYLVMCHHMVGFSVTYLVMRHREAAKASHFFGYHMKTTVLGFFGVMRILFIHPWSHFPFLYTSHQLLNGVKDLCVDSLTVSGSKERLFKVCYVSDTTFEFQIILEGWISFIWDCSLFHISTSVHFSKYCVVQKKGICPCPHTVDMHQVATAYCASLCISSTSRSWYQGLVSAAV